LEINRSKARGTAFETDVVNYLNAYGIPVRRMPPAGSKDVGDVQTFDGQWVFEIKNTKSIDLAGACDELDAEMLNADNAALKSAKRGDNPVVRGAAIIKRVRKNVSEAYVVMPLREFADLIMEFEGYNVDV
jgi:hypothetical protein